MGWFDSVQSPKLKNIKKVESSTNTPTAMWKKCVGCGEILQDEKLEETFQICPYCEHHYRLSPKKRLELLVDKNSFSPFALELTSSDPLNFVDKKKYKDRLQAEYKKTGMLDGTYCGTAKIGGREVAIGIMDFSFMGGSMGVVTGEKIALVMDMAYEKRIPAIILSCSGGARMQKGILSLMQMAKTSGARNRLKNAKIPYISVIADPTTGGVAASYAILGDVNIAEPKALIGFAGPRVIEQSIRQVLPEGFQRAEFLKDHGFIDRIVHRHKLKDEISFFINLFMENNQKQFDLC